jgi:hypothetical protein
MKMEKYEVKAIEASRGKYGNVPSPAPTMNNLETKGMVPSPAPRPAPNPQAPPQSTKK